MLAYLIRDSFVQEKTVIIDDIHYVMEATLYPITTSVVFSAIADQLVSKMKHELCVDRGAPCRGDSPTSSIWEKVSESPVSDFCSAPEDASDNESDGPVSTSRALSPTRGSPSCRPPSCGSPSRGSPSRGSPSRGSPSRTCVSPMCDRVPGMLSHYCVICASHMVRAQARRLYTAWFIFY